MPGSPAPWLADLPDEWVPQKIESFKRVTSPATNRSLASVHGSMGRDRTALSPSSRGGLTELNQRAQNARDGSTRNSAGKSGTVQSIDSVVRYDTVERQSSPKKQDADLEWKRRLVDGDLGYGDQTELFGPSGLENIFQSPTKTPTSAAKRPSRLRQQETMPSSPPPWPPAVVFSQSNRGMRSRSRKGSASDVHEHSAGALKEQQLDHPKPSDSSRFDGDGSSFHDSSGELSHVASTLRDQQVSGQTEVGNETFSPVYISKHTTLNGDIGYTALDSETARMMQKSSVLSSHSSARPSQPSGPHFPRSDEIINLMDDSIPAVEISLPDNLPTGTPPIARLGDFVNTKRGGLSNCGSFKTRPLSPSDPESRKSSVNLMQIGAQDFGAPLAKDRAQVGAEVQQERPEHTASPQTPDRNGAASILLELPTPKSGGSPLKLFGAYDTFTNSRLLRRLSQLEDPAKVAASADEDRSGFADSSQEGQGIDEVDGSNIHLQQFQDDDIDELDFEANLSFPSANQEQQGFLSRDGSPEPDILPPGARSPFAFHVDECENPSDTFGIKRKLSDRSTNKSSRPVPMNRSPSSSTQQSMERRQVKHGDIVQESPVKLPTPKRQRTLHKLDLELERLSLHDTIGQNFEGDDSVPTAVIVGEDLESSFVLPQPRPRNPTPHQRRRAEGEKPSDPLMSSPKLQAIRDSIEESNLPGSMKLVSQAKAVANDLATFTLNVTKEGGDAGDRKRSITTQDFLDEAMHIMSLIRARGRPQSGLGSVEESNEECQITLETRSRPRERSPSLLRVSRPPSRDGMTSGWRPRSQPQGNPQVTSQLQRFQEKDDIEILDTTLHSLKLRGLQDCDDDEAEQGGIDEYEFDDSASIRIHEPVQQSDDSDLEADEAEMHQVDSLGSNNSAGYSTGRTQGTNSTRKSDNVATLAPETVAHLIPEEVAGMTFDRTQGKWVRLKQEKFRPVHRQSPYPPSNITSDDDPFGNIPDLTVDEYQEMQQVHSSQTSNQQKMQLSKGRTDHGRHSSQDESTFARPQSHYGGAHPAMKSSTARAYSVLHTSDQIETRATSYATEHAYNHEEKVTRNHQHQDNFEDSQLSNPFDLESFSDVRDRQANAVRGVREEGAEEMEDLERPESVVEELPAREPLPKNDRRVSFQTQTFMSKRRHGQDVEQSEISLIAEMPDKRVVSVSVALSRPFQHDTESLRNRAVSSDLLLSDLPDFTVAELDEQPGITERYLSTTVAQHGLEVANDRYALAVQDMVKKLTDAKGDELYWEDVKQLALRKQGVHSLHGLSDFCTRLQRLDVSDNKMSHLEGAPTSLRWMDASRNLFSSLTAWNHLQNLQYLDVSHNEITSLDGFGCLYHLRELRASHNSISSLDGLKGLDGLIRIDVDHNELTAIDFSHFEWPHLQIINLSSNRLSQVYSVDNLTSLKILILDVNKLDQLNLVSSYRTTSLLQELSLAQNRINHLDLKSVPELRYLDLDGNSISSLPGLADLEHLDVLSLRKQSSITELSSLWRVVFSAPIHARSVYLSGNSLPQDLYTDAAQNTVSHLELASCSITSLPRDFGLHFPNLQHLNLNFNALKDVRPILNIQRLRNLLAAGNRLGRLRKCIETLAHLKGLEVVDLRDNPITLGFYPAKGINEVERGTLGTLTRRGDLALTEDISEDATMTIIQAQKASAYSLRQSSSEANVEHRKLMDEDTRLRRRVYEILLGSSCAELSTLDSVTFDRKGAMQRDAAWTRLKELGVLKVKTAS